MSTPLFILSGPTASGKTGFAIEYCSQYNLKHPESPFEIISCDSLTVYESFNIGSAKPTITEQKSVKHHLLSIQPIEQRFDAAQFVLKVEQILEELKARNAKAMIVGGTGFYLKAFLFGMWDAPPKNEHFRKNLETFTDAEISVQLLERFPHWPFKFSKNDRYRMIRVLELSQTPEGLKSFLEQEDDQPKTCIRSNLHFLWIDREENELKDRIRQRTQIMLKQGLIEEVKTILELCPEAPGLESVGYREVVDYFKGIKPEGRKLREGLLGLEDEITLSTIQLVKKQRTFFRGQIQKHLLSQCRLFQLPAEEAILSQYLDEACMS